MAASNKGNNIATRSVTQIVHANARARRGRCGLMLPENASKTSKKKEPVATTGSKIYKAPYLHEGNLYHESIRR